EYDAQHSHAILKPGIEWVKPMSKEFVFTSCNKTGTTCHIQGHMHQNGDKRMKGLPMSYFEKLPRQDEPEQTRSRPGLNAVDETTRDHKLELVKQNITEQVTGCTKLTKEEIAKIFTSRTYQKFEKEAPLEYIEELLNNSHEIDCGPLLAWEEVLSRTVDTKTQKVVFSGMAEHAIKYQPVKDKAARK
ncbi:hypothetical protein LTR66_017913, partial [Elasticomyces elasticus]